MAQGTFHLFESLLKAGGKPSTWWQAIFISAVHALQQESQICRVKPTGRPTGSRDKAGRAVAEAHSSPPKLPQLVNTDKLALAN